MSSETSASESTPLRRPDSRNSGTIFTSNNAINIVNNVPQSPIHLIRANVITEPVNQTRSNYNKKNTGIHINHNNNSNINENNLNFLTTQQISQQQQQQEQQQQREELPELDTSVIKMDTNIRILCRVGLDILILLCVGFSIMGFYFWGDSYKRGFFCDDESLKHPFKDSTVRNWMLYFIGILIPLGVMFTVEFIRSQQAKNKCSGTNGGRHYVFMNYEIPDWMVECYKKMGIFAFGAGACQLTTDIAKYSIGRLRPHFFAVCQPQMNDGTTCADPINAGRYIVDFTCAGIGSTARMLKEVRLSFPSGHSSFTFFAMVYVALYLQSRMCWHGSKLLRHFLQFVVIMIAWYTALSRVSDYKHHWSDVLAGSAIGAISALIVANYISDLFNDDDRTKSYTLPRTLRDVPAPPPSQSPTQVIITNSH